MGDRRTSEDGFPSLHQSPARVWCHHDRQARALEDQAEDEVRRRRRVALPQYDVWQTGVQSLS